MRSCKCWRAHSCWSLSWGTSEWCCAAAAYVCKTCGREGHSAAEHAGVRLPCRSLQSEMCVQAQVAWQLQICISSARLRTRMCSQRGWVRCRGVPVLQHNIGLTASHQSVDCSLLLQIAYARSWCRNLSSLCRICLQRTPSSLCKHA